MDYTDRFVLRFAILYEFYKAEHEITDGGGWAMNIAMPIIKQMNFKESEKDAAMRYLVECDLVHGKNDAAQCGILTHITRINSRGVNFIESVVCQTNFNSIKDELLTGEKLDDDHGKAQVLGRVMKEAVSGVVSTSSSQLLGLLCKKACEHIPGFTGSI
ncbi:MAG: hypothetical protein MPL62_04775 [Alphaproteobacteria bacterium]|nr:hypothetical protein [Alphaproteobacteria bacterium]